MFLINLLVQELLLNSKTPEICCGLIALGLAYRNEIRHFDLYG